MAVLTAYVLAFSAAALVCFGALWPVRRLSDADTQRGLSGLLVLSGLWATATVARLLVTDVQTKATFHLFGLTVGLAAVGAWLYFCSAYAGRDYHRRPRLRYLALGVFVLIVSVKLTNPIHGLYFTARLDPTPFPHLAVVKLPLNWAVTLFAYALTFVGFGLLYDLLRESSYDTTSLTVLLLLTGLPVGLDLLAAFALTPLLRVNYEPLGVAVFAVGVVLFVEEKFVAVSTFGRRQVVERLSEPVVFVDYEDVLRDYNQAAAELFPTLTGRIGDVLTDLELGLESDDEAITVAGEDGPEYYLKTETPLTVGATTIGQALVFTDVTTLERQRLELDRQNRQLGEFADAIDHELRNTMSIIRGHIQLASNRLDTTNEASTDSLAVAEQTARRMARVVEDLSLLARYGRTLDGVDSCDVRALARRGWDRTDTGEMSLRVDTDDVVMAEEDRFTALFIELFELAHHTGSKTVTVTTDRTAGQLRLTTDGDPIPDELVDQAFEYGNPAPHADISMSLPSIRTLARVHGWTVDVDRQYDDGVRLLIGDVDFDVDFEVDADGTTE